ncbi:aminoglycoside phosphotransferase family protein [Streptomyces maremycinicus]|uniref:aminoglycoside phosphotransferase family protein n=1 Tax=Streptomyces maremycinicus TaxID=1679753 RepID=UPI0007897DC4|nr:aminoglycoside phosphotransferase family protein [Streptomyces sp. NBRC 110468]
MIEVPQAFVNSTVQREGKRGAGWVEGLPALVAELLDRWGCAPDGEVLHGGVGIVVPVRRSADRIRAVIKVSFPHPGNVHEPDAFAAWGGQGAVRLYERDDARFAMLLERVRESSLAEVEDTGEVAAVAGRISRRLAVPAPDGLPRLSDKAGGWRRQLLLDQAEFDQALPARTVDAALDTVRELGRGQPDLLVHGDLHAKNILRAEREPWLAVDPKGWVGDPAYDGGTLLKPLIFQHVMRHGDGDLRRAAHRILDHFAEAAGLDRERTRRWAHLHLVQAAFHGRRHGFRIAREGPGLDLVTQFLDRLAETLTPYRHPSHP